MNNLKKKLLKMYSTLTIYQNAYRLKSGLLAGITGLSAVGYGNLNTNLVKSPNSSLKISEPLYQEAYEILLLILNYLLKVVLLHNDLLNQ